MTGALIQKSESSDVSRLIALSQRTIRSSYADFLGHDAVEGYVSSGAVDDYVAENVDRCWVISNDTEIVGYAVTKDSLIDLMMIDAGHHREGYGSQLLAHCERELFQSHDRLRLESFSENLPANNFYRKHGWHEWRRISDDESGQEKIEFIKAR